MPTSYRIAPIAAVAALLAACAPASAWALACPSDDSVRNPEVPPLPTVVSYAVTRSAGPASEREREAHEASVIGGHATEGEVRIDMRLSADVPADCDLIVDIIDPGVSDSTRDRFGHTGSVGRTLVKPQLTVHTDGTNRLVVRMKTLAAGSGGTESLAFTIGNWNSIARPTRHPFTVRRSSFGDISMTMSAPSAMTGTPVVVTATVPAGFDREAFGEAALFKVDPPSAGTFSSQATYSSQAEFDAQSSVRNAPGRGEAPVNAAFAPQRAQNIFRPAQVTSPVNATITASVLGRAKTMPFTVLPVPVACGVVGEHKLVPEGIELKIINTDDRTCPAYRVEMRKMNSPVIETREIPALTPAPKLSRTISPIEQRNIVMLRGVPVGAATTSSSSSSWTGTFRLNDVSLPVGSAISTRLIPLSGGGSAIALEPFTIPSPRGNIPTRN